MEDKNKEKINVVELFGSNVFNDKIMRERLPKKVYKELHKTIDEGKELDPITAEGVAGAMKDWAVEKGATHYTHWFQPLTGFTAEKHDAFITAPHADGTVSMEFSGKELSKGEPDASSFPSGGLRSTFEARGYTAWDCTSPAFVKKSPDGKRSILYIPTAFCSYTGEALDQKTPLLRSMEAINKQSIRLLRLFGNTTSQKVTPSVGVEQEYFLVDREKYLKRKDLVFTGRTLFGANPPKGQEMDDHYFGAIRERIAAFMTDVNEELWKMGVAAKTQHNEVAPGQHELAPIYAQCNVAVDHNQLIMETLKKVAYRHNLQCLLHEKPFEGVNGSGKHNNWSLVTDDGINILDPGKTPHDNIQFLLVLTCILRAVDLHADLLRESASDVGNDHRLGANEAPPAIISAYLGEQLEDVLAQLIDTGEAAHSLKGGKLHTGVSTLPDFAKDATDRNRTSPFAFTGNKFEFRMLGSEASVANPNIILNTAVAECVHQFAEQLKDVPEDKMEDAIHELIKKTIIDHKRVSFNGNCYTDEWIEEAEKRGLFNLKSTPDALPQWIADKNIELFTKYHIFTKEEIESRYEIWLESYSKILNIESNTMVEMVQKDFLPSVFAYIDKVAATAVAKKSVVSDVSTASEGKLIKELSQLADEISTGLETLKADTAKALATEDPLANAKAYQTVVLSDMDELRKSVDAAETLIPDALLPYPTYDKLLFSV